MKKLIMLILVVASPILHASDFEHKIEIKQGLVKFDKNQFELIYENDEYNFYFRKNLVKIDSEEYAVHTMVEYKSPNGVEYPEYNISVKKIYNFGILNCKQKSIDLLTDVFTDNEEVVVFIANYDFGIFRSELASPNTARNAVYNKVCVK
jgi:hypothetical protein